MRIPFQAETTIFVSDEEIIISQDPEGTFDAQTVAFNRSAAELLLVKLQSVLSDAEWGLTD